MELQAQTQAEAEHQAEARDDIELELLPLTGGQPDRRAGQRPVARCATRLLLYVSDPGNREYWHERGGGDGSERERGQGQSVADPACRRRRVGEPPDAVDP